MAPPAGLTWQSSVPAKRGVRGGTQKNVCRLAGVACFWPGNRIGAKFAWLQLEEASEQKEKKNQKGVLKKVHKYMSCINLHMYI